MNIIEELGAAKVVGITGHIRPDGDCTGSVLGLYNYLKDNAPDIDVNVYLEQPSDKLSYLNGFDAIKNVIEPDKKFDAFTVASITINACHTSISTYCYFKPAIQRIT